ncbi:MAG: hypothetical protein M1815_000046 [Lichina confinis]|nr:MAG: hypothetical protein M1815_000046 [Lichina confinis]
MARCTAGRSLAAILLLFSLSVGPVLGQDGPPSTTDAPSTTGSPASWDGPPPWVSDRDPGPPPWVREQMQRQGGGEGGGDRPPSWVISSWVQEEQASSPTAFSSVASSTTSRTTSEATPKATDAAAGRTAPNSRSQDSGTASRTSGTSNQTKRNVQIIIAVLLSVTVVTLFVLGGIVFMDRKHQRRVGFFRRKGSPRGDADDMEPLKQAENGPGLWVRAGRWTGCHTSGGGGGSARGGKSLSRLWYGNRGRTEDDDGRRGRGPAVGGSWPWPSRSSQIGSPHERDPEKHPRAAHTARSSLDMEPRHPGLARSYTSDDEDEKPLPRPLSTRSSIISVDRFSLR